MDIYDTTQDILRLIDESSSDAYIYFYEMVSSILFELKESWINGFHDKTDEQLASSSRSLKRICKHMAGRQYSIEYEAGRLSGIVESFEALFRQELETYAIDATLAELLSRSKPASKHVLKVLYEARKEDPWVSNSKLAEICDQSPSALSNIMKRLVQAHAIDYVKEGRIVSYRLTPAGIRYYENSIKHAAIDTFAGGLDHLIDKTDIIQDMIEEVLQQQKRQTQSISKIENRLPLYKSIDRNASQNKISYLVYANASTSKFDNSEPSLENESNITYDGIA